MKDYDLNIGFVYSKSMVSTVIHRDQSIFYSIQISSIITQYTSGRETHELV